MENYIVSARKYRPMTFDAVVGQPALTTTLKNAVKSGKLAHAYLFCGPRGVGKTTCARIFAKAINCLNPSPDGEACNECESCKAFNEHRSYNIFELDAASNNSVDDIRTLMEETRIRPQVGKYKVFIIDEVHMLSNNAWNAFLKTLEEPPAHVIFILATTEKHKVLPTILSRCQIFDFERMTVPAIVNHLKMVASKEGIKYDEPSLNVIAQKADGGMRDALSIFDQVTSFCQGNITYDKVLEDLNVLDSENYFKLIDLALDNKVSDIMLLLNSIISRGFDGGNLINGLASHVRNVLMAKDPQTLSLLEVSDEQKQKFQAQSQKCPVGFLYKSLEIMNRCDMGYRQSSNKRLLVELTLIEIAQITQPDDEGSGSGRGPKRLKILFKKINAQQAPAPQVAGTNRPLGKSAVPLSQEQEGIAVSEPLMAETSVASPAHVSVPVSKLNAAAPSQPSQGSQGKPRIKLSNISMTFKDLEREPEKHEYQSDEEINHKEEEKFSQEDLDLQWMQMCARMPKSMIGIASRMKNMRPVITDYPDIEVVVDNEILLEQVKGIERRIIATMSKFLHNGNIHLKLRLATKEEVGKVMTRRDIFNEMRHDNPAIEKLRLAFGLELD